MNTEMVINGLTNEFDTVNTIEKCIEFKDKISAVKKDIQHDFKYGIIFDTEYNELNRKLTRLNMKNEQLIRNILY